MKLRFVNLTEKDLNIIIIRIFLKTEFDIGLILKVWQP